MSDLPDFDAAFRALTGHDPFPWQRALYRRLVEGNLPRSCDIPTGLGKTAVLHVWLIALANHPDKVPRRLVYVVNRRTVVDQTTNEAVSLRDNAPKIGIHDLAISTLRGQLADNQEWSADPARPAVIIGTVDMIGSRLLFSGYRIGFKSRPLHAGFLGQDALLVHDEAHLEPAFQKLIKAIEQEQHQGEQSSHLPWPKLRVMALSATGRNGQEDDQAEKPFELTPQERDAPEEVPEPGNNDPPLYRVWRRLKAKKRLALHNAGDGKDAVAKEITKRAELYSDSNAAVLLFVRTLDDIGTVEKELSKTKRPIELLTGTMRGKERDKLVEKPTFQRFLRDRSRSETVYLLCTSAGEVGIDISADHMVCDLSTFESMAQRLGRVHRYGEPTEHVAQIDVVCPTSFGRIDKKTGEIKANEIDKRRQKTLDLLRRLPEIDPTGDDGKPTYDASPKALMELRQRPDLPYIIADAFAPEPTILPVTDILFDAWALTTIRESMPGRPPVVPYLHGLAEWQPFETYVAWREEVEILESEELRERYKPVDLLEDYPLKPHELLRDATDRKGSGVFAQLAKIAARQPDAPVWIIDSRGQINPTTLQAMINTGNAALHDATVLLPPCVGGLSRSGTLNGDAGHGDALQYDVADEWYEDKERTIKRRVRLRGESRDPVPPEDMRWMRTIDSNPAADETEPVETMPSRFWHWYTRPRSADDDLSKSAAKPVEWGTHVRDVVRRIDRILAGLALPAEIAQAVRVAGKLHDHGKRRPQFQSALGNRAYPELVLAKSGRSGAKLPETCRHEFGSLADAVEDAEFQALSPQMQDLALHLIGAHHGRGRPHFLIEEVYDPAPGRTQAQGDRLACAVPRRFARLQRKYGRWGLAYLESLLRAADWAASADPSEFLDETKKVST